MKHMMSPKLLNQCKLILVVAIGFGSLSLLIWGKLQLKKVPRTAVAVPNQQKKSATAEYKEFDKGAAATASSEKSKRQSTDVNQAAIRTAATALRLQATHPGDPAYATINGQSLSPGDQIQGYVLRRVMPNAVVLENNGIEIRLELHQ